MTILQKLSQWQKLQAQKEGVEGYMVLPFGALKLIAASIPGSETELLSIKGVGPAKVRKYGKDVLTICSGSMPAVSGGDVGGAFAQSEAVNAILGPPARTGEYQDVPFGEVGPPVHSETVTMSTEVPSHIDPITGEILGDPEEVAVEIDARDDVDGVLFVGDFLEQLNQILGSYFGQVKVRGEVIGFKRNQNGHAYFEVKDADAIMRCSIFRVAYDLSGVDLRDGVEVIITGKPSHHARYGFSFIGEFVELAGEGALKKAYDALKSKFFDEGFLSESRKRSIPELPQRVGLITSPTGAAIGDFTTNVGQYGYHIAFHGASVEGARAVSEILSALKKLATMDLDVLVITRGGGSLESLQAFNNENVVRAIAEFPVPVIAGIGHEQDETLSTLVADLGVSTPTAAARAVRVSWDDVYDRVSRSQQVIMSAYEQVLSKKAGEIQSHAYILERYLDRFLERCSRAFQAFDSGVARISESILQHKAQLKYYEKMLVQYHPERQLKLGYSIVRNAAGKIIRHKKDVMKGDSVQIQLSDGSIDVTAD